MKISALRLFNVKRFASRGIAIEGIGDGVNVLCAINEFGKSTSFEALHALFFQPHSGTPGDVQRLRPYSGGSPLIEADITTAEGHFRITKQYYGSRFARVTDLATNRLLAQADEAENFIAGLVRGGTAGPAGLLWVRQGVTGIEKRSRAEEEGDNKVRAGLLESVQGEVEAVTGGRRMAEIMAAAEHALSQIVTPGGKAKAGGRYAVALAERERLAAGEQKLSAEVGALREALDNRATATRRLSELDRAGDRQERQKAIAEAQSAFEEAKAQSEMLKTAEAELMLASERHAGVVRSITAFRSALDNARDLRTRLQAAERCKSEAVTRRREAADAIGAATDDAETAEITEDEMRDLLGRLDAAAKARAARERLAGLQERLREAEVVREAVENKEAELPLVTIPAGAIDELQTVEIDLAKLRAVEQAERPSVAIAYEPDAAALVTMDGVPLKTEEERGYDVQARLSLPGIGTITLRSNRPPRSDERLARAAAKRRTLLASMGVEDLVAARQKEARAQQLDADLREMRSRLSLLAPEGLHKLREEIAAYAAISPETVDLKDDPAQVRASLAEAEERRKAARQALREAEPGRAAAEQAFVAAERALATLNAELKQVDAILGPGEGRAEREAALSTALSDLERIVATAKAHAESLRIAATDLERMAARLGRARSVEEGAEKEIGTLRVRIAGLDAEIRTRSDDAVEETWRETAEALSAAKTRVQAFEREVAVLDRLRSALDAARSQARELYLKPVMTELRPLLRLLFDDVSVTFDDKTLLPHTILRNGQEEEVDRLSGGMREQLSILTRLAFARLLARNGRPAPIILDDALVYSDDDRIEKMFDALHQQSRDQQIIIFSCRQRAFQKLGGKILQTTEWQP